MRLVLHTTSPYYYKNIFSRNARKRADPYMALLKGILSEGCTVPLVYKCVISMYGNKWQYNTKPARTTQSESIPDYFINAISYENTYERFVIRSIRR